MKWNLFFCWKFFLRAADLFHSSIFFLPPSTRRNSHRSTHPPPPPPLPLFDLLARFVAPCFCPFVGTDFPPGYMIASPKSKKRASTLWLVLALVSIYNIPWSLAYFCKSGDKRGVRVGRERSKWEKSVQEKQKVRGKNNLLPHRQILQPASRSDRFLFRIT